ncbi:hypothetical protein ACFQO7_06455 [Catellatospora aurea]|uniref:PAS domain-containing protein n=1 Tax=Catellatospora aurea TaxID=1337874 RepID=A0ABW2GQ91_9ACTN
MEQLIAEWVVRIWQTRRLGQHAPCWDPAGEHSPNTLFAAVMAQGGFALQIPTAELYYQLLPAHHVAIHDRRGVMIRGLWFGGPALDDCRDAVAGTRDLVAPVAYVQTPVTATPKSVCEAILDFYGADHAKMTLRAVIGFPLPQDLGRSLKDQSGGRLSCYARVQDPTVPTPRPWT